jgi:hypothetical protein
MNDYLYKQFSFAAEEIEAGYLEGKIKEMLVADYTILSTHTMRAANGFDLFVIIFKSTLLKQK